MADIEKVLQELPNISEMLYQMYKDETDKESISVRYDQYLTVNDALELLKEQQPKEPMQLKYSETREEYWFYESICPKCGSRWISNVIDHFCPACGQPVFDPYEEEQKDGEQE